MSKIISLTEFYNNIGQVISNEIKFYTPQLFSVNSHNSKLPPRADATAILLTINDRYFLMTAAHVIHQEDLTKIGIMIDRDFYSIGGKLWYFEPNDLDSHEPNFEDIAIVELHPDMVKVILRLYKFLPWVKVSSNHVPKFRNPYIVFGYPEVLTTKHFPTKQILPKPFLLRTIAVKEDFYLINKIDKNKTIALYADSNHVTLNNSKKIVALPELGGISGCGVWYISDIYSEVPQYQLVSIITGEDSDRTTLFSSRMFNAKRILKDQFKVEDV